MTAPSGLRLAVDFGTSNTVAMLRWPDGRVRPLLFDGSPLLSSAVLLGVDGHLYTGRDAAHLGRANPERLEPNPKRRIDDHCVLLGDREVPHLATAARCGPTGRRRRCADHGRDVIDRARWVGQQAGRDDDGSRSGNEPGRTLATTEEGTPMAANAIPQITLNDGNTIPQLGFGVFQIDPKDTAEAVSRALQIGYRHIDTAEMYGNEKGVGEAVRSSGLDRADVYVTSKLNNGYHRPDDARKAFETSLSDLGFDYLDLFLIHWPLPTLYDGDFVSTWKVLEEFKRDGRARSIGVSNFQVKHLERLAAEAEVVPAVNQIEAHPYFTNDEVRRYDQQHRIATEAWSPIAQGKVLDDPVIKEIAQRVGRTPAQVVLRWHIQRGDIVFPKSTTPSRMEENFALFDFELDNADVDRISALDKGEPGRTGPNPDTFDYVPG